MPLYDYRCNCGKFVPDVFAKVDEYKVPCPACSKPMERQLSAPAVKRPMVSYISPASGRIITSEAARRDDLKRTGCIEYDPGLKQDAARREREEEKKLDAQIEDSVVRTAGELGIPL